MRTMPGVVALATFKRAINLQSIFNWQDNSSRVVRLNKADATTPAYGHPSSPEEGSYKYLAG